MATACWPYLIVEGTSSSTTSRRKRKATRGTPSRQDSKTYSPDVPVDGVILRVSCAACLLESMPNGAVAFIADSEEEALCEMEPEKLEVVRCLHLSSLLPISIAEKGFSPLQGAQGTTRPRSSEGAKRLARRYAPSSTPSRKSHVDCDRGQLKADHHNALWTTTSEDGPAAQHVPRFSFLGVVGFQSAEAVASGTARRQASATRFVLGCGQEGAPHNEVAVD